MFTTTASRASRKKPPRSPPALASKVAAYTVGPSDDGRMFTLNGSFTLGLQPSACLGNRFSFSWRNTGTRRVVIDPFGSEQIDGASSLSTYPNQSGTVFCDSSAFYSVGQLPCRWRATTPTLYVDAALGNAANDGLAAGSGNALATIQSAIDFGLNYTDAVVGGVQVIVADGTYVENLTVTQDTVGGNQVSIVGNTTTPANVVLAASSGTILYVKDKGICTASGVTFTPTASGVTCLKAEQLAVADVSHFRMTSAPSGNHIVASNAATINITSNYDLVGDGSSTTHFSASNGGLIAQEQFNCTITGTWSFVYFANCTDRGGIHRTTGTISGGTVTGQRYLSQLVASINTNGGGANFYPGDVAGSTAFGGQYT